MDDNILRRAVAEFVGTYTLLVAVTASLALAGTIAGTFGAALTQGLALAVMITAVGHVSGGHFNPAVTLGFFLTRRIGAAFAAAYIVVQLVAAIAGVVTVDQLFPDSLDTSAAVPALTDGVEPWQGLLLEALLTFFLVWVVFGVAVDGRGAGAAVAGMAIGLTVAVDILIGGPLTGGSMNPARAFGPMLIEGEWDNVWLYLVGPLLGGAIAALLYVTLYLEEKPAATAPDSAAH